MKRNSIIIILAIMNFATVFGQTKNVICNCPKTVYAGTKADTTFQLSNGKSIVLCGYKNPGTKPTTFSEFILAVCGQDTIIDFWGAILTCRLNVNKDTLFVELLKNLPIGLNFKFQETVWTTEKIYFNKQKIVRKLFVNKQITKYNNEEIRTVLTNFEREKPDLNENKIEIANQLFIAAVSGILKEHRFANNYA
jgi:hypothetical protein